MLTCPCNVDPLTLYFNMIILCFTEVDIIFLLAHLSRRLIGELIVD